MSFSYLMGTAMRDADEHAEKVLEYQDFLESKRIRSIPTGFEVPRESLHPKLFPFQRDIVHWLVRRGRGACFADCGLGKTFIELEWAKHVVLRTQKPVLTFAPLAVSQQTKLDGERFAIRIDILSEQVNVGEIQAITNYEKLSHFTDPSQFGGVVLDESSILKGFDGKTRKALTEWCSTIPFRIACTATPAPNDYMELGNHAEFLGIMTCAEMLAIFFTHDGGETSKWRLKKHATDVFWKWVASWAVALRRPSDLGHDDTGFILPPLEIHQIQVKCEIPEGHLFPVEAGSLQERNRARKSSIEDRVAATAGLVNTSSEPWIIWCNLNAESAALHAAIWDSVEVVGSDSQAFKESSMLDFSRGKIRVLITKPSIAGFGMNWQHCANVAFVGLSDSYEQFYQAVRRCWRFGQTKTVNCFVITSEAEGAVVRNIERKEQQATEMMEGMVRHMKDEMQKNLRGSEREVSEYSRRTESGERWTAHLGDCVDQVRSILDESIDYSIFSPPFASLYTYSNSERDMGNSKDYAEFESHFRFLVSELFRVTRPGRLLSFHCMNLPISKEREGFIGIRDFRGELIRMFIAAGWIFHSEVVIWKDPVTAMQRTKALGLLYKQLRKDSCMSRQGIPDYLVTMRKPGINPTPVTKVAPPSGSTFKHVRNVPVNEFSVDKWQNYASPVWMDINPSDTLQRTSARAEDDERHICPLQLEVIERAIELWTNPDDLVLSPFMGIGSEGHVALKQGRRFMGIELKESYFVQAVANLKFAETHAQADLFAGVDAEVI